MLVVLAQWVLKPIRLLIYFLSPRCLTLRSIYPAFYILRFYNKHTIGRHYNVIYLSCSVVCWQGYIMKRSVLRATRDSLCHREADKGFTKPTLNRRCFQYINRCGYKEKPPKIQKELNKAIENYKIGRASC